MLERGRRIFTFAAIFFALLAIVRIALGRGRSALPAKQNRLDGPRLIAASRTRMQKAIADCDATAYADCFSEDALSITPAGARLAGRAALERATRASLDLGRVCEAGIETSDLRSFDGTFVEEGRFWLELERTTGAVRSAGRYTAVWKCERDRWKIVFETARAS